MSVRVGIDVLRDSVYEAVRGKRIGLFTHPAAVDSRLKSTQHILTHTDAVTVGALFGAEHGISGAVTAGEKVESTVNGEAKIPVYSLYGETFKPTPDMLAGLDAIVCDVQDVGARFFTYTWTMSYLLEAASEAGIEVIILDRPNPLGGDVVDGELLDPALESLVGRFAIPIQHGMTIGELARLINETWVATPARLTVIPCVGWQRTVTWEQTGLTWVAPSPNTAHLTGVKQYPGACLIEGTNLSEGRGTPLPFEITGAPFIDGEELADRLNAMEWIGARFRPIAFIPTASKHTGTLCNGVQAHIVEPLLFFPIRIWLGVIMAICSRYPDAFAWEASFDRLAGTARVREQVAAGVTHREITTAWDDVREAFLRQRKPFLLYD